jgi:hypothetical protein
MTRDIATETEAYQALLEGRRAHPGDEAMSRYLAQAKAALEVAWLGHTGSATRPTPAAAHPAPVR